MGLDVFTYVVKRPRKQRENESENKYLWSIKKSQDKKFTKECKKVCSEWFAKLAETPENEVPFAISQFYWVMKEYFKYDFQTSKLKEANTVEEAKAWYDGINWEWFYKPEAAYFRKVNCIYNYFAPRLNEEMCRVTKEDIKDIMERAMTVLLEHDEETSKELFPTREGFFFGSTDYDEWYYNDMVTILKEFGNLLREWTDDRDVCFIYMSW